MDVGILSTYFTCQLLILYTQGGFFSRLGALKELENLGNYLPQRPNKGGKLLNVKQIPTDNSV